MGKRNSDIFYFKNFSLIHRNSAMKVGTDGVLLGSWGDVTGNNILDIGSGCGLIAIMAAQRNVNAIITGIEPDLPSFEESKINGKNCPFSERVNFVNSDLGEFLKSDFKYDSIISNPPFYNDGFLPESLSKAKAKHSSFSLSYDTLLDGVSLLLSKEGRFSVILPSSSDSSFIEKAKKRGLFRIKKAEVFPTPEKQPSRIMSVFSFTPSECILESIILEKYGRHNYSEEYISLTKDFLLHKNK